MTRMNTETFTKPILQNKAKALASGGLGLSAASVIFLYMNFVTKSELNEVKASNTAQWAVLSDLKADAKANDAIIRYYFHSPTETSTNIANP